MKNMLPVLVAGLFLVAPALNSSVAFASDETAAVESTNAAAEARAVTFADGSTGVIEGDHVFTTDAEGVRTPAADGDHTLNDGTVVSVKDGMVVHGAAHGE